MGEKCTQIVNTLWCLYVAELNEIYVPGVLFAEFVLDIPADAQQYEENSTINDGSCGNGKIDQQHDSDKLSAAELEEAAAASAKSDKHFNLFKEAMATNSCQVWQLQLPTIIAICSMC